MDSKGRVSIPSKFRDILHKHYDDQLIVSLGRGFLVAYPNEEWEKLEENVRRLPPFSNVVKEYKRLVISAAQECPIDGQGRILVPPELRDRAGLKEKILFVGMIECFEIWDRNAYLGKYDQMMEKLPEIEEQLFLMSSSKTGSQNEPR
jgi:MraZ protein